MGACMWKEICYISSHPNARAAMIEFCKQQRELREERDYRMVYGLGLSKSLPNLYAFSAVVGYKKSSYKESPENKPLYGPNFAKFIEKNKLGRLIETWDGLINRNHPNHKVKIWLWNPDQKALSAWWNKNRPMSIKDGDKYYYVDANNPACENREINKLKKKQREQKSIEKSIDLVQAAALGEL